MFGELTNDELNALMDAMFAANKKCYKLAMFAASHDDLWRSVNGVHNDVSDTLFTAGKELYRRLTGSTS